MSLGFIKFIIKSLVLFLKKYDYIMVKQKKKIYYRIKIMRKRRII